MDYREFEVGDKVVVVNEPYLECPRAFCFRRDK